MKKRRKRRKLKKGFKIFLISILVAVLVVLVIIFGFKLQTIKVKFDLNQYTEAEVKAYFKAKKIDNTFVFWFRNKIGKSEKIDLFEKYSVKINSPTKVTVTAYEKKFKGYIKDDKMYAYLDDTGKVLKYASEKIKSIPKITGLKYEKLVLYETIQVKDEKAFDTLLKIMTGIEEYDFKVKKIDISDNLDITLFIKDIQVQLGKTSNLKQKLSALNDMYDNVIKYKGVLNMKRVSSDGSYTMEKTETETKQNTKKKKE